MAGFTRVNGDFQPVMNVDASAYTNSGAANAVTTGVTVNVAGPKLDFFTITAAAAITPAEFALAVQTVQSAATIYMYEYTDAAADTIAVAVYPTAAWTSTTLQTAVQALGGLAPGLAAAAVTASATFTN